MKVTKKDLAALAKKVFKVVEEDLRDRRGIRHEWDQVDLEIQKEIRTTNEKRIASVLAPILGVKL